MAVTSVWSSQGLIAHYSDAKNAKNKNIITLIDQTVSFGDPFYRQVLSLKETKEELASLHWNSSGSHLLTVSKGGTIEIFSQTVNSFYFIDFH